MTTRRLTTWTLAIAVALAMQSAYVNSALAQIYRTYNVTHNFTLTPGGTVMPTVTGNYYAHAWVKEGGPSCTDWDVVPGGQPGGWGSYGRDKLRSGARVRNSGNGGGNVWATTASVNIPAGGFGPMTYTASTTGCASGGTANSRITVNPYGAGTPVTGEIRSYGNVLGTLASGNRVARAYAFSMTSVQAQGGTPMASGMIVWGPVVRDVVSGSASRTTRRQRDPIEFVVEDLDTGEVIEGTLLSIDAESVLGEQAGGFVWENDLVAIDSGADVNFAIDQTSPYVSPNGALQLIVQGGVVTQSEDSGVYDGILPPVGTPTPLAFPLTNEIQFDYDFGDFGGHELDVTLDLHGSGEAEIENGSMLPWHESFDDYVTGSPMHGEGGWKGWNGDPAFGATVTDLQARSIPDALDVSGTADLVREFVDASSGQWTFTAWLYVPEDFNNGDPIMDPPGTYFILLNRYNDGGPYTWSVQLVFDGDTGLLVGDCGAENNVTMPYIAGQWVEIRVDIFLDPQHDWTQVYYNDVLLDDPALPDHPELGGGYQWSTGVFGNDPDGLLNIGAVDLFANGATSVYYDDLSLEAAGAECIGDLNGDGVTGHADLGVLLADWGCMGDCAGDLDGDGMTGHSDLGILLGDWGCGT